MDRAANGVLARLEGLRREGLSAFSAKLIPGYEPERVIGVPIPALRKEATRLSAEEREAILGLKEHRLLELGLLHSILVSNLRASELESHLWPFLPQIDCWAICDVLQPKILRKDEALALTLMHRALDMEAEYARRWGLVGPGRLLVRHPQIDEGVIGTIAGVRDERMAVLMGQAWCLADALAYDPDSVISVLRETPLPDSAHKLLLRKARESRRVSPETIAQL